MSDPTGATSLNWFKVTVSLEQRTLGELVSLLEESIEGTLASRIPKLKKNMNGEHPDYVAELAGEITQLNEELPNEMRYACVLLIYGRFEHLLFDLAHSAHDDGKASRPPGIDQKANKSRDYLAACGLPEGSFGGSSWDTLFGVLRIRNYIAHNAGHIETEKNRNVADVRLARQYIKAHSDVLSLDRNGFVRIKRGYCEQLVEHFSAVHLLASELEKLDSSATTKKERVPKPKNKKR